MECYSVPNKIRHTHAIGRVGYDKFSLIAKEKGYDQNPNLEINEYIYDMSVRQAAADVIICRAGAMTMSELAIRGSTAIFIPSPNVTDDHQYKNARLLADAGAALVYRENEIDGKLLANAVDDLLKNPNKRNRMSDGIKNFAMTNSIDLIVENALALLG